MISPKDGSMNIFFEYSAKYSPTHQPSTIKNHLASKNFGLKTARHGNPEHPSNSLEKYKMNAFATNSYGKTEKYLHKNLMIQAITDKPALRSEQSCTDFKKKASNRIYIDENSYSKSKINWHEDASVGSSKIKKNILLDQRGKNSSFKLKNSILSNNSMNSVDKKLSDRDIKKLIETNRDALSSKNHTFNNSSENFFLKDKEYYNNLSQIEYNNLNKINREYIGIGAESLLNGKNEKFNYKKYNDQLIKS
jgi:hypothetical protein